MFSRDGKFPVVPISSLAGYPELGLKLILDGHQGCSIGGYPHTVIEIQVVGDPANFPAWKGDLIDLELIRGSQFGGGHYQSVSARKPRRAPNPSPAMSSNGCFRASCRINRQEALDNGGRSGLAGCRDPFPVG